MMPPTPAFAQSVAISSTASLAATMMQQSGASGSAATEGWQARSPIFS